MEVSFSKQLVSEPPCCCSCCCCCFVSIVVIVDSNRECGHCTPAGKSDKRQRNRFHSLDHSGNRDHTSGSLCLASRACSKHTRSHQPNNDSNRQSNKATEMSYSLPIDLQERPRIVNTATTSIEHTDTEQCAAAAVAAGQT
jgi:hypothetical protein